MRIRIQVSQCAGASTLIVCGTDRRGRSRWSRWTRRDTGRRWHTAGPRSRWFQTRTTDPHRPPYSSRCCWSTCRRFHTAGSSLRVYESITAVYIIRSVMTPIEYMYMPWPRLNWSHMMVVYKYYWNDLCHVIMTSCTTHPDVCRHKKLHTKKAIFVIFSIIWCVKSE